ncbi:hypothetical protein [Evansella halocellulosilytica]|uniref:hypothetical protein n=1 Tax=Evansella halocellulosilytica TaxID=2011013 RepID=UPI000BB67FFE|nr:hypothetical protein [Evansella halocellulosilytica]
MGALVLSCHLEERLDLLIEKEKALLHEISELKKEEEEIQTLFSERILELEYKNIILKRNLAMFDN